MRQIKHIVIHCTATAQHATVQAIQNYWKNNLKWKSPGYHKIIQPDGRVVTLAEDEAVCNGVAGHNAASLHVSYIGGIDAKGNAKDNRTPQQKAAMEQVVREWLGKHPGARVLGHRDFPGVAKACPSFDVKTWWESVSCMPV